MNTKSIDSIMLSKSELESAEFKKIARSMLIPKAEALLTEKMKEILENMKTVLRDNNWIRIDNKKVYYHKAERVIIPDTTRIYCSRTGFKLQFEGFDGSIMSRKLASNLFYEYKQYNPLIKDNRIINYHDNYNGSHWDCVACQDNGNEMYIGIDGGSGSWGYLDQDTICIPVVTLSKYDSVLFDFIYYSLIPSQLNNDLKKELNELFRLKDSNTISINQYGKVTVENKKLLIIGGIPNMLMELFSDENLMNGLTEYQANLFDSENGNLSFLFDKYLNCDHLRADIEPYDVKCLTDINRGHWDLWNENDPEAPEIQNSDGLDSEEKTEMTVISINPSLVARNPAADIHWDGIVGIDFGTKSTVVSYQDETDKLYLHRIGVGNVSQKAEPEQYENPTVMEFINLERFMERYNASEGRPKTLWDDLTVSHTAQNNFNKSDASDLFYSYFYDLKQWCGDTASDYQIKIKDHNGNERILSTYAELGEDDFDPIELYAYYLGLYINNMRNGIYIDYIMSFPVNYEKKVRDKIIRSFEKGIKKSLPEVILKNEDVMSKFRVQQGASEPACYAMCALQQFNIEPDEDENVFYSIFDFGGGTTDFDFGIWRLADEDDPEEEDYDYVIEHFGAGGDKYLGGENLLELLSYHIFRNNADKLLAKSSGESNHRSAGFSFCKPTECDVFDGHESLIAFSQEARRNTKSLMEKLRPFVEGLEVKGDVIVSSSDVLWNDLIEVDLFDKNGSMHSSVTLDVNEDELITVLRNRIEKGVMNFFHALLSNYENQDLQNIKSVYIFLAGNSSKSPLVKELFDRYMEEYTGVICDKYKLEENELFKVYAPLGTPEANEQQKKNGVEVDENSITRPTGKTGVAYGLLEGRKGSGILVKSEVRANDEIPFAFYVGVNRKKLFRTILPKGTEYNKWIRLKNAVTTDFYIYYSSLPIVDGNSSSIDNIKKKKCILPDEYGSKYSVYIRAVKPNVIEYTVSDENGINQNEYLINPQSVELND